MSGLAEYPKAPQRKPLVTCQCSRWPDEPPCKRTATAEDFLCDSCRAATSGVPDHCSRIQANGRVFVSHVKIEWWP